MRQLVALLFCTFITFYSTAMACPGCAGSMGTNKDKYTVYILMAFIALTYIPFFILYKMIYKFRKKQDQMEMKHVDPA